MPSRLRKIVSALTLVTSSLSYLSNSLERMKKPAKKLFTFRVLVLLHFCLDTLPVLLALLMKAIPEKKI